MTAPPGPCFFAQSAIPHPAGVEGPKIKGIGAQGKKWVFGSVAPFQRTEDGMDMPKKKQSGAKGPATCEEGRPRYHPPAYAPDRLALVALEAAIGTLELWTCRPVEIRSALNIPSCRSLARWRCAKDSIPSSTRERVAVVSALRDRLVDAVDLITLKPQALLELPDRHESSGRSVRAGPLFGEILALLKQLGFEERDTRGRLGRPEEKPE